MKTPEQIAEEAAQKLVTEHDIEHVDGESAVQALAWDLGVGQLTYEAGLTALVARAIEIDRTELYKLVLSFEPDAIRDHFEADEDDPTEGLTDDQLLDVAQAALSSDRLYETFHEVLVETLKEHT